MHRVSIALSVIAGCLLIPGLPVRGQTPDVKQERQRSYEQAKALLEAELTRSSASGDQAVATGRIWIRLGDLARGSNKPAEGEAAYATAVSILGNRVEAAVPLTNLGIYAILKKDEQRALQLLNQAYLLDPANGGLAMMWSAVAHANLQQMDQAEADYRSALTIQEPQSLAAATTMDLFARFLRSQNRETDASSFSSQANSIRSAHASRQLASLPKTTGVGRVGGGTLAPNLVYKVEPEYSDEARAAKFQGAVVLSVEVWEDGTVHNARITRGLGFGLDEKALEAVSRWKFKPATRENQPVKVVANIEVSFRLL